MTRFTILSRRRRGLRRHGRPARRGRRRRDRGARHLPRGALRRQHPEDGVSDDPRAAPPRRRGLEPGRVLLGRRARRARRTTRSRTSASPTRCSSRTCRTRARIGSIACRPRRRTSMLRRSATRASCAWPSTRAAPSRRRSTSSGSAWGRTATRPACFPARRRLTRPSAGPSPTGPRTRMRGA